MYQKKDKFKSILSKSGFGLVVLVLLATTTAVFVAVFNGVDVRSSVTPIASNCESVKEQSRVSSLGSYTEKKVQRPDDWKLVLVNYDNKLPDNFEKHIVHQLNVYTDSRIVEPYRNMHKAALQENVNIYISSGYRSEKKQEVLYKKEIKAFSKKGIGYDDVVSKASTSVARPGYSEHNTGLAIDINGVLDNFDETKAFKWMEQHAHEYGFVLRYQKDKQEFTKIKYEPWHYRYVGIENAKKMNELNLCLEEYIDYLKINQTASN